MSKAGIQKRKIRFVEILILSGKFGEEPKIHREANKKIDSFENLNFIFLYLWP